MDPNHPSGNVLKYNPAAQASDHMAGKEFSLICPQGRYWHASQFEQPDQDSRIGVAMEESGQRAEFERKILLQLDPTLRVAIRLTGNHHQAEELMQETMLKATANWKSFRHHATFKTWLYRILINAFRDQLRRRKKWNIDSTEIDKCVDRSASVDATAAAVELHDMIAGMINELPPRQREVLVLSAYDGMSVDQIADTLEISPANVHSNLSLARKKLKEQLSSP